MHAGPRMVARCHLGARAGGSVRQGVGDEPSAEKVAALQSAGGAEHRRKPPADRGRSGEHNRASTTTGDWRRRQGTTAAWGETHSVTTCQRVRLVSRCSASPASAAGPSVATVSHRAGDSCNSVSDACGCRGRYSLRGRLAVAFSRNAGGIHGIAWRSAPCHWEHCLCSRPGALHWTGYCASIDGTIVLVDSCPPTG